MEEKDLTRSQRAIVEAEDDLILVLGGAGCGKTTTALWAARAELQRQPSSSVRVAFLTFSRTAVDQIGSRSRAALTTYQDRIEVSTFHALAFRIVRSFGRYAAYGPELPQLQSPAQVRLHGPQKDLLTYDDLIPLALDLLRSERLRALLAERWPLIICDEFQDTSDDQWSLLDMLRRESRLLLLADPNQMIYSFLPGVGPQRLNQVKKVADLVVELEPASHRDPSGMIPALALSIMSRNFEAETVRHAIKLGRFRVITQVRDNQLVEIIRDELRRAWRAGARSYGIFGHSNEGVATLSHELSQAGIDHVLVGLPDAQAEAIAAMTVMCQFAVGIADDSNMRNALATFLTACSRGKRAPDLAVALANGYPLLAPWSND